MKFLRSAALTVTTAAVVLLPTAAHADTLSHYDATGDVMGVVYDEATDTETPTPAPARKQGDVSKVRISFEGETIRISATFRALVKSGPIHFHSIRLVTSKVQRNVDIFATSGFWQGDSQMTKYGSPVNCAGLTHKLDYTAKVAVVSFPRNCLSASGVKPGAIRAGWGTYIAEADDTFYIDDAFADAPVTGDSALTLSPKVFR